jgi:DNA invertase Pin-like site-specific DNA recombinase
MTVVGYARVSTDEQTVAQQRRALEAAGCQRIFQDEGISGSATRRPGLDAALAAVGEGDVLVVWKLDRLGRSLPHLIEIVTGLGERGVAFRSLTEQIDTTTAGGRLVFHVMGALADFERDLISERTRAGMDAAKARGARVGRKPSLTSGQLQHIRRLREQGETLGSLARSFGVSRTTVWRHLASHRPT